MAAPANAGAAGESMTMEATCAWASMAKLSVVAAIAGVKARMNGNFLRAHITPPTSSDECFLKLFRRRGSRGGVISFRQPLSPGFNGEGNDQQSDHEGGGGGRHRNSQTAVAVNHRSQHEIDAGADETAEGSCESERGGAHRRAVLLGQP